ncbi:MAG: IMP dehydrogenase [Candidatus Niyogibacteria bacterium]|nr:MAG: IMP dehydrogenase [Candidatus Niyogibacteria bacterium]
MSTHKNLAEGLTFDDVLLVPKKSRVFSRRDVSLKANFSKNIELSLPLVSANMDTVTESRMARFLAEVGGIGIIHRFLTVEREVEEVKKVKRAENVVIDDPYTIFPHQSIAEARDLMAKAGVSGLLVADDKKKLVGILTSRDLLFEGENGKKVSEIMTKKVVSAPVGVSPAKAKEILHKYRIEKLPIVSKSGVVKGLITLKDILKKSRNPFASKDKKGRLLVAAAIGVKDDALERAKALLEAGADAIVVDIAHGHNIRALEMVKILKKKFAGIEVVAGNVATPEGVLDLIKAGADAVKVGIGPGAACTTRVVTGVGVPQLTAVLNCVGSASKFGIPVIADGGVKNSGDFSKALAAGADTVMAGSLFAGTDEAPGEYIMEDGQSFKLFRGMASRDAAEDKNKLDGIDPLTALEAGGFSRLPEGKAGRVAYSGSAKNVVGDLIGGLRSSMSYLGAKNLKEFRRNAEFIKITQASFKEGQARN